MNKEPVYNIQAQMHGHMQQHSYCAAVETLAKRSLTMSD